MKTVLERHRRRRMPACMVAGFVVKRKIYTRYREKIMQRQTGKSAARKDVVHTVVVTYLVEVHRMP